VMGYYVKMRSKAAEIITLKKLRKDGSLSIDIIENISNSLMNGEVVVIPTDSTYGIIYLPTISDVQERVTKLIKSTESKAVRLISSFKMLGEIASINKFDYDFLNRIWPGEVIVVLKGKKSDNILKSDSLAVQFPKAKFLHSIISMIGSPLVFFYAINKKGSPIYKKKEIIEVYKNSADLIFIVDELCRKFPFCTQIDISEDCLNIIGEGRVSSEEIKSLYFLGKADDVEY